MGNQSYHESLFDSEALTAEQMNGLATPGTGTSNNPAPSVLLATGDQALFTDADNNVWLSNFDWLGFGLDVQDTNPLDDTTLTYIDSNGLPWLTSDGLSRATRDFYDSHGNIIEEVAPDNTTQQYQYNSFAEVTQYTDQEDDITSYSYNSKGDLTQVADALSDITTYAYNNAGLVTSTTDPNNNTTTYAYNNLNELTSTTSALGGVTTYSYDNAGDLTSTTDPVGNVTTYSYNALDGLTDKTLPDTPGVSSTYTYTYDKVGNLLSSTDPNNHTTTYGYNAVNEQTSVTNALNQTTTYGYDGNGNLTTITNPLNQTTTYAYNAANEESSVTDPMGNTTSFGYDAAGERMTVTDPMGNVTLDTYTPRGEVASESVLANTPMQTTGTYGAKPAGSASSGTGLYSGSGAVQVSAKGNAVRRGSSNDSSSNCLTLTQQIANTYYGCGCLDTTTLYNLSGLGGGGGSSRNASGAISGIFQSGTQFGGSLSGSIGADNSVSLSGSGTVIVDNNSYTYGVALSGYDCANYAVGTFSFIGFPGDYNGIFQGTVSGNTLSGTFTATQSGGSQTVNGRFSVTLSGSGSGGPTSGETTTYGRNALHQITSITDGNGNVTQLSYDKSGNATSVTDANNHTTNLTYNAFNQESSVTNGLAQTTKYGYNKQGLMTSVTDPQGNDPTYTYDAQGRLLTATNNDGGVTTYKYDLAGNETSITDPVGNVTSYSYDASNQLVSMTNPMGHATTYAYNQGGLLTSTTDADGRTINYAYNADGQESSQTWVGANYTATYAYNADSELTSASDPFSTYTYTYNALGQQTSVSNAGTPGVPTVTLSYGYDSFGNRTSLTDSLGGSVSYSYDADNQLTGLGLSVSDILYAQLTMSYDGAGNLTGLTRTAPSVSGDTITSTYSYDKANGLTNILDTDTTKSTTLANYTYAYNANGDVSSYQDNSGNSLTYGYDAADQLTSATGSLAGSNYTFTYNYDLNGNRTSTSTDVNGSLTSATYTTSTGNELTNDGTYSYTYDNAGNTLTQTNLATGSVTYYTWDYENRLTEVKVEDKNGTVLNDETFTYDVFGNRIAVSLNGTPQLYTVYDGANPYMDFNASGTLTWRYLTNPLGLSQFYGQVDANGNTQWFLTDNLGSIRVVVDTSGNVLDAITYDPYGNILTQTNAASEPTVGFAGGRADAITDNDQFDGRYYNPSNGLWLSQDPLAFEARDSNLYRYVFNRPTSLVDPSGELGDPVTVTLGGIVATGVGVFGIGVLVGYGISKATGIGDRLGERIGDWLYPPEPPFVPKPMPNPNPLPNPQPAPRGDCPPPDGGPKRKPKRDCQTIWEQDLARCARIAAEMKRMGLPAEEIANFVRACNQRANDRKGRCESGGDDTLPPWPAPPGIED